MMASLMEITFYTFEDPCLSNLFLEIAERSVLEASVSNQILKTADNEIPTHASSFVCIIISLIISLPSRTASGNLGAKYS